MHYRLYQPEDFAALYAIEEVCFQPPFRFERRYMQRLVHAKNAATWIAEDAGAMAGFAIVEWSGAGTYAYIPTIEVLPDRRGRGIGGELLRRLEGSAREAGTWALWLHVDESNVSAIRLYEVHGFVSAGKEEHFYAPGRGAFLYRKELKGQ
jgi:[ribosomal protein S18]-alanine N-acetyltransferase